MGIIYHIFGVFMEAFGIKFDFGKYFIMKLRLNSRKPKETWNF